MNFRIKIVAVVFVLAVALSSLGPLARRVSAFTGSGSGNVTIYKVHGTLFNNVKPHLYDGGTIVYRRAGSTGAQVVRNSYEIWRWNGAQWVKFYTTPINSKTIPNNVNSVRMPQLSVLPSQVANYYYIVQKIEWMSPIGGILGSYTVYMNHAGDYKCANVSPQKCGVGNGYIYLAPGP